MWDGYFTLLGRVLSLSWHPSGTQIAAGTMDMIRVFNVTTGETCTALLQWGKVYTIMTLEEHAVQSPAYIGFCSWSRVDVDTKSDGVSTVNNLVVCDLYFRYNMQHFSWKCGLKHICHVAAY